jgi:predicted  nucleic acid-binding Zn-ribbon protein
VGREAEEVLMSELGEVLREELESFRELRDELRVQAELGRSELRDRVRELERRWHRLESRFAGIRQDAKGDAEDVREAVRLLARELKEGFEHVKARLS